MCTTTDLFALDVEGGVRARATVPEPVAAPLVAGSERAVAVSATGNVYGWTPGRPVKKLGSFGQRLDGGAALLGRDTLVAVAGASQLLAMDLTRGTVSTHADAQGGLYLGPPALLGSAAYLFAIAQGHTFLVGLDESGREITRSGLGSAASLAAADGGAPVAPAGHRAAPGRPHGTWRCHARRPARRRIALGRRSALTGRLGPQAHRRVERPPCLERRQRARADAGRLRRGVGVGTIPGGSRAAVDVPGSTDSLRA